MPEWRTLPGARGIRVGFWVLGIILLGAVGTGFWEYFLRDFVEWFSRVCLSGISGVSASYVDTLHGEIGKARTDHLSFIPWALAATTITAGPWLVVFALNSWTREIIRRHRERAEPDEQTPEELDRSWKDFERRGKRMLIVGVLLAAAATIVYGHDAIEGTYTRKACIFVERSIDIVAPHVSAHEILVLRGQYRAVDNAQKFYELEDTLRAIAARSGAELPEFNSIR